MQARPVRPSLLVAGLALAGLAALLSGCGKSNPMAATGQSTGSAADQAAVSGAVAGTTTLVDDGLMESADQALFSATTPGAATAIRPLRYWRRITNVRRSYSFAFADTDTTGRPTRATVTVHKELTGTFNIAFDATPGDTTPLDTVAVVHKPLHDLWVRQILLRRVHHNKPGGDLVLGSGPEDGHDGHHDDEWKVAGISGVDVRSFDPGASSEGSPAFGATKIQSLHIQSVSVDTVITDPLQFLMLRRIHTFGPSEDVTLTVTTSSNTDVLVLVRGGGMRRRFTNNGDNTYSLTWHTASEDGVHHFGINALSNGTLFDDQAAYDSDAWIFPYLIRPCVVADYLP